MSDNTKEFRDFYCGDDDNWQVSDADAEYEIDEEVESADLIDEENAQVTVADKDGHNSGLYLDADLARSDASDVEATESPSDEENNEMLVSEEIVIACKDMIKEQCEEGGEMSHDDDMGDEFEEDEKSEVVDE